MNLHSNNKTDIHSILLLILFLSFKMQLLHLSRVIWIHSTIAVPDSGGFLQILSHVIKTETVIVVNQGLGQLFLLLFLCLLKLFGFSAHKQFIFTKNQIIILATAFRLRDRILLFPEKLIIAHYNRSYYNFSSVVKNFILLSEKRHCSVVVYVH